MAEHRSSSAGLHSDALNSSFEVAGASSTKVEVNKDSVSASAPGKVILFGEHSVVYGKPAIAAALSDLRISVLLTPYVLKRNDQSPSVKNEPKVQIVMADLGLNVQISKSCIIASTVYKTLPMPPTLDTVTQIDQFLQTSRASGDLKIISLPEANKFELSLLPIVPVIFLLDQLAPTSFWTNSVQAMKMWVRSRDLPVGAGLGSSAAFSVALSAALFQWNKRANANGVASDCNAITQPTVEELQEINKYAFASEILLHGTPSGLDNAVSTHGGALWYTKTDAAAPKPASDDTNTINGGNKISESSMTALESFPTLELLLVHTHVPRSTKALVAGVRQLYNRHKPVIEPILHAMAEIVIEVRDILTSSTIPHADNAPVDSTQQSTRTYNDEAFLELVRLNQDCLRALGVSHPRLDEIDQLIRTKYSQVAAAKLTGAGGGGCALVLLSPSPSTVVTSGASTDQEERPNSEREKALKEIEMDLKPLGNTIIRSKVGGSGVVWEYPHLFSISDEDETPQQRGKYRNRARALVLDDLDDSGNRWPIRLAAVAGGMFAYFLVKNGLGSVGRRN
ncbi:hypothetical protein ACA910_013507 [Epithemia clementina (nom. ined.)]